MQKRKARFIVYDKVLSANGVIVEIKIWEVTGDNNYPDGFRYSLYAVYSTTILVGYDNHHPKGHHRHIDNREESYNYTTLENLRNDFKSDLEVQLAKRGLT